jgi:hypothetical protein
MPKNPYVTPEELAKKVYETYGIFANKPIIKDVIMPSIGMFISPKTKESIWPWVNAVKMHNRQMIKGMKNINKF